LAKKLLNCGEKMINKKFFMGMLALVFGMTVAGCASMMAGLNVAPLKEIEAAQYIQPDELCQLDLSEYITVTSFDEKSVNWRKEDWSANLSRTVVNMPAGTHTIAGQFVSNGNNGSETYKFAIDFNFEAGRVYLLSIKNDYAAWLTDGGS
jgi:hypothetical protein